MSPYQYTKNTTRVLSYSDNYEQRNDKTGTEKDHTQKPSTMYRSDPQMAYNQVFLLGAYMYAITLMILIKVVTL